MRTTIACWICFAANLLLNPQIAYSQSEVLLTERIDGSPVTIYVDRPNVTGKFPVVLFIDGSGCQSGKREGFEAFSKLPEPYAEDAARVIVEKPGVTPDSVAGQCSETFLNYYTIDQRVLDHLRAIQHLRAHADWWNGDIKLVGWSDGAMIGVSIASFTPEVSRVVFLALGGGIPMSTQFKDYILCADDRTDTREECMDDLDRVYADIRTNPSPERSWLGDANTYKAWVTRIDAVEYHLVKDIRVPMLMIHGEFDRDSVPVEAARELVRLLSNHNDVDFEYWEVPGASHQIGIEVHGQSQAIRLSLFNWLFEQPVGPGGPPQFGRIAQ